MTKKVYYEDNWLEFCEALVLECEKNGDEYAILLDKTVIFPEGGGQPSDTGFINTVKVIRAEEKGEDIWHITEQPFQREEKVQVRLDIDKRRDHSQQHSGEHVLSGLASSMFQAKNVGFHMAEDYATIDLDTALSAEQLEELLQSANRVIQNNLPVSYRFVQAEELEGIELRKRANGLKGDVRIVYIGDVDSCTCCGTHCKSTGEIGYIMLSAWQNYKGGVRLWFLCGMRAVKAAQERQRVVERLAKRFSCKYEELQNAVYKQGDELSSAKKELKERTGELMRYKAAELLEKVETVNGYKLIVVREDQFAPGELKLFSELLVKAENAIVLLFTMREDTLHYVMSASNKCSFSMRELCEAVNAATGGRGGGKDSFAQGSAKLNSGVAEMLVQLKTYLGAKIRNLS